MSKADMKGALDRRMVLIGIACVVGITMLIVEMLGTLAYTPADWWQPEVPLPPGRIRFREMIICPGLLGWLGTWGYLAAWLWLPIALWRIARTRRNGGDLRLLDRILPAVVAAQIVALQCLLRLTPLRYGYPLL